MNLNFKFPLFFLAAFTITACHTDHTAEHIRPVVDTVGFARLDWQMDSIMERIALQETNDTSYHISQFRDVPRVVISPHDDYTYVGKLYAAALEPIKAGTVIIFGVAHKARQFGLENRLIFDSYTSWQGPYGEVKVSPLRERITESLDKQYYMIHDTMHAVEHSIEALLPFLQYYNRQVEIIPILVPYMSFERIQQLAEVLAASIHQSATEMNWSWGDDFTILISTDAVHYGDEDWGGKDFAVYGTDSTGYEQALEHEKMIVDILSGNLVPAKVKAFCDITVREDDYQEYQWTWCGRYSVPMGLMASYALNERCCKHPLEGVPIGYANSIDHPTLRVDDLNMGRTAPAHMRHWVGYAAMAYQ